MHARVLKSLHIKDNPTNFEIGFENKVSSSAVHSDIKHDLDQAQIVLDPKQFQWKTSSPYRSQGGSQVLGFGGTCEDPQKT